MAERKKPNRTGVSLGGYVSPEVYAALNRYVDETEPRPNKTSIIEMLLKQFLRDKGYWPPPDGTEPAKPRRRKKAD